MGKKRRSTLDVPTWFQQNFAEPARRAARKAREQKEVEEYKKTLVEWMKHPIKEVDVLTGRKLEASEATKHIFSR